VSHLCGAALHSPAGERGEGGRSFHEEALMASSAADDEDGGLTQFSERALFRVLLLLLLLAIGLGPVFYSLEMPTSNAIFLEVFLVDPCGLPSLAIFSLSLVYPRSFLTYAGSSSFSFLVPILRYLVRCLVCRFLCLVLRIFISDVLGLCMCLCMFSSLRVRSNFYRTA